MLVLDHLAKSRQSRSTTQTRKMHIRPTQRSNVIGHVEKYVEPFLDAHRTNVAHQELPAELQGCIGRNQPKCLQIRPVPHDKDILRRYPAAPYRQVAVAVV